GFSAAAQPTPADAQALAMAEEKLRFRIQATGNALRRRIIHEMERIGTLDQREVELRAFAKAAHTEPERALRAAAELERRRILGTGGSANPAPGRTTPGAGLVPSLDRRERPGPSPHPARPRWPPGTCFM